jgi:hypothetical protein
MKKFLISLAVLLAMAIASTALAQSSFGLRVGANFPNIHRVFPVDDVDFESLENPGFAAGLVAEIGITPIFAFQPELLFSQHGYRIEEEFMEETMKASIRYNYLQMPLLAKVRFGNNFSGFNINVGPHIGYGIGDIKATVEMGDEKEDDEVTWDEAHTNRLDFGITGGIGVNFGNLGLDLRYQLGLANMLEDPLEGYKMTNRNFQISLSYLIPFVK